MKRTSWGILVIAFLLAAVSARAQVGSGEPRYATGTGFVVTSDGYLLTNAHVIEDGEEIEVFLSGRRYGGRVVKQWYDESADLALLKIVASDLRALPFADSGEIQRGERVSVFGFPFLDVLGAGLKMTEGIVSGFVPAPRRFIPVLAAPIGSDDAAFNIQVDAAINPGNSGGPIVNQRGEVIGIATSKIVLPHTDNAGLAQPVEVAKDFLTGYSPPWAASKAPGDTGVRWMAPRSSGRLEGTALDRAVSPSVALIRTRLRSELISQQRAHHRRIAAVAVSSDSKILATAGEDGAVRLWRLPEGEPIDERTGRGAWERSPITAIAFSPSGAVAIAAAPGVWLWDPATEKFDLLGRIAPVRRLAFSPRGGALLAAGTGVSVQCFRTGNWSVLWSERNIDDIAFSPAGDLLLIVRSPLEGARAYVSLRSYPSRLPAAWDGQGCLTAGSGQIYGSDQAETSPPGSIGFSPDGRTVILVVGETANFIDGDKIASFFLIDGKEITRFWIDGREITLRETRRPVTRSVFTVSRTADVMVTATVSEESSLSATPMAAPKGHVAVWNTRTRTLIRDLGQLSPVWLPSAVAISPDGKLLITANDGGDFRVWDLLQLER